tara:strand:+ start:5995 stop:6672 length:678 start_codon:yes stop_codon:yes gene_type:complete
MAIPYEERGWSPSSEQWNKPKPKPKPEGSVDDDATLAASIEVAQPIQTPISTLDERISSEIVTPTEQKIKGVGIGLKRSSKWSQHFDKAEKENNLPRGSLLSIAAVESMGDPMAGSSAGAKGLMQFMPNIAISVGLRVDDKVDERTDPVKSIYAAGKFFGNLVKKSDGNVNEALMKYNWGWGNVSKWKSNPDSVMPMETRQYLGRWNAAMQLQQESSKTKNSPAP